MDLIEETNWDYVFGLSIAICSTNLNLKTRLLYCNINGFNVLSILLSRTEEPAKADTCAHYRRALQQHALNVQVKHSDLTC